MEPQPIWSFLTSVGCGAGLGALVGLERQWRSSVAGLRTNTLVSLGAALFVSIEASTGQPQFRITAQIVSGIGFIGGGAILREGFTIRGVNTAATLWCSAAIGSLCGIGRLGQAAAGTAFILAANIVLRPITYRLAEGKRWRAYEETHYSLTVKCNSSEELPVRQAIIGGADRQKLMMRSLRSGSDGPSSAVTVTGMLVSATRADAVVEAIVQEIKAKADIIAIEWGIAGQGNELE